MIYHHKTRNSVVKLNNNLKLQKYFEKIFYRRVFTELKLLEKKETYHLIPT